MDWSRWLVPFKHPKYSSDKTVKTTVDSRMIRRRWHPPPMTDCNGATVIPGYESGAMRRALMGDASTAMELPMGSESGVIDLIGELRLRQWARLNYVPESDRTDEWHPIVLDEMRRRDGELSQPDGAQSRNG